jgi:hypothetical protein
MNENNFDLLWPNPKADKNGIEIKCCIKGSTRVEPMMLVFLLGSI